MKLNKVGFFVIVLIMALLPSCTHKEKEEEALKVEDATSIINKYYESMEKRDINTLESLFYRKVTLDKSMYNFDYIGNIEILSIDKLDNSLDTSKVYVDYISEEYKVNKDKILLYNVSFKIHVKEGFDKSLECESSQKFSLIEGNNEYRIAELFR
ncbi:MAG: DUF4829 domain-containing protein [Clostridium sp.]